MSGGQVMVVLIVAMAMVAGVLKAWGGGRKSRGQEGPDRIDHAETVRMREEMRMLKELVAVLERIATDRNHALEHEIERLRDR